MDFSQWKRSVSSPVSSNYSDVHESNRKRFQKYSSISIHLKKHPTTCIKISTMVSGMNLIFLAYFLISLAWGNLDDNNDTGSSPTVLEKEQPVITKEYFREEFDDEDEWQERWVLSKYRSDYGKFRIGSGKFYGDREKDIGLQTTQDIRYYAVSARFPPFNNENQTLVVQYTVKYDQQVDCGGAYIKLFSVDLNQEILNEDSPYYIMFGPDICGKYKKVVQVILNYKDDYYFIKKNITCETDDFTHLYTLILRPDLTYEIKIDNYVVEAGHLEEDWDFLPPKRIIDNDLSKPDYWDERPTISDPTHKKPDDWDQPQRIPDPTVIKPDDWDEEMDGAWEPPLIPNPEYKGIWKPRIIKNPNYNGIWVQPEVDNPEYKPDPNIYKFYNISVIGLEILQGKSGTIFDNFLITNDEDYAEDAGNEMWGVTFEREWRRREGQDAAFKNINEKEPKKEIKKEKKKKATKVKDEL